ALKGFGRRKTQQVSDLAKGQFRVTDIGHCKVAPSVIENRAKARAFFRQFAAQGPGGQLQSCCHFLQIRLPPTIQQRSQQLSDAFTQAAGARELFQFPLTQLQQMPPGARDMVRVAQPEHALAQAQLVHARRETHRVFTQCAIFMGVGRGVEFDLDLFGNDLSARQCGKLMQPACENRIH
nr:hypothetical protein [Tanacetum cinerariifolium]